MKSCSECIRFIEIIYCDSAQDIVQRGLARTRSRVCTWQGRHRHLARCSSVCSMLKQSHECEMPDPIGFSTLQIEIADQRGTHLLQVW